MTLAVLASVSLISVVFPQEMAAILEVSIIRFKRVFDISWLSLGNCVAALICDYEPLMVVLEESATAGDATAIGNSAVWLRNGERVLNSMPACQLTDNRICCLSTYIWSFVYADLHLQLSRTHLVHLIHFAGGVLTEKNSLNCHFQERGVTFSSIRYVVCRLFPHLQPCHFDELWIIMCTFVQLSRDGVITAIMSFHYSSSSKIAVADWRRR